MPIDMTPAQLTMLTQWLSPAFPVGAFSYSHGMEFSVSETPELDVEAWLADVMQFGAGRTDAILLRAGFDGAAEEADTLGRAISPSAERVLETSQQGAAFCRTLRCAFGIDVGNLIYPVALGTAAARESMPIEPVLTLYLHAFTSNLVAAAQRLTALGQTEAQAITGRLAPICSQLVETTQGCTLDDLGGSAWGADVASMKHETMETRIFRT